MKICLSFVPFDQLAIESEHMGGGLGQNNENEYPVGNETKVNG